MKSSDSNSGFFSSTFYVLLVRVIPAVCLILSLFIAGLEKAHIDDINERHFNSQVEKLLNLVKKRVHLYQYGLMGTRSLMVLKETPTREAFRRAIQSRDIPSEFPGAIGIGYIDAIRKEEAKRYEAEVRRDNSPTFSVRTSGEHKDAFVIRYIEPEELNLQAIGFDIGQEAHRRRAAELSRDTGRAVISAPITLVQSKHGGQAFLYLLPV